MAFRFENKIYMETVDEGFGKNKRNIGRNFTTRSSCISSPTDCFLNNCP